MVKYYIDVNMKVIKNKTGWSEVTTTNIEVSKIGYNIFQLDGWLSFNAKNPSIGRKRHKCQCCRKDFKDLNCDISLAITNKGNKPLCVNCADMFINNGIESFSTHKTIS